MQEGHFPPGEPWLPCDPLSSCTKRPNKGTFPPLLVASTPPSPVTLPRTFMKSSRQQQNAPDLSPKRLPEEGLCTHSRLFKNNCVESPEKTWQPLGLQAGCGSKERNLQGSRGKGTPFQDTAGPHGGGVPHAVLHLPRLRPFPDAPPGAISLLLPSSRKGGGAPRRSLQTTRPRAHSPASGGKALSPPKEGARGSGRLKGTLDQRPLRLEGANCCTKGHFGTPAHFSSGLAACQLLQKWAPLLLYGSAL